MTGQLYHVTTRAVLSAAPFAEAEIAFAACRAIHRFFHSSGSTCLAWVVMPDHMHLLIEMGDRDSLSANVGSLKKTVSSQVNTARDTMGSKLWQPGFHDRALRKDDDLVAVARYIVANPVRAGLVTRVGDYPWWNAVWI